MTDIFLPLNEDDSGASRDISKRLERLGWTVWPGADDLYVNANVQRLEQLAKTASTTIIVWTPSNRTSTWIRLIAIEAHQKKRLVQVVLGGGAPPRDTAESPTIKVAEIDADGAAVDELIKDLYPEIETRSGTPIARIDSAIHVRPAADDQVSASHAAPKQGDAALLKVHVDPVADAAPLPQEPNAHSKLARRKARAAFIMAAAIAVAAPSLFLLKEAMSGRGPSGLSMSADLDSGTTETPVAVSAWDAVDKTSVDDLKRYLENHAADESAHKARAMLMGLEEDAHADAVYEKDALKSLIKLEAFDRQFPNSLHAEDIQRRRIRQEQIRDVAEEYLVALGYSDASPRPLSISKLRDALDRFETQLALPRRGIVDQSLIETLKTALAERERMEKRMADLKTPSPAPAPEVERTPAAPSPTPPGDAPQDLDTSAIKAPLAASTTYAGPAKTGPAKTGNDSKGASPSPTPSAANTPGAPKKVARRQAVAPQPEDVATFRDCPRCPLMARLPGGVFSMGDNTGVGDVDEQPVRAVVIPAFAIGVYEITFEEWDACIADGACRLRPGDMAWGRKNRPVINVSWSDTRQFLNWLNKTSGESYRLPSEAEWEYAARAGSDRDYAFGDDVAMLCRYGNGADQSTKRHYQWSNMSCDDGVGRITARVGSYEKNRFGLYDMHGNVWEWTEDCWHDDYAGAPNDADAWTSKCRGEDRVLRGGAFSVQPSYMRSAYRYSFNQREAMPFFGFRVARDLD